MFIAWFTDDSTIRCPVCLTMWLAQKHNITTTQEIEFIRSERRRRAVDAWPARYPGYDYIYDEDGDIIMDKPAKIHDDDPVLDIAKRVTGISDHEEFEDGLRCSICDDELVEPTTTPCDACLTAVGSGSDENSALAKLYLHYEQILCQTHYTDAENDLIADIVANLETLQSQCMAQGDSAGYYYVQRYIERIESRGQYISDLRDTLNSRVSIADEEDRTLFWQVVNVIEQTVQAHNRDGLFDIFPAFEFINKKRGKDLVRNIADPRLTTA